jgi:serine/threonine protein kinase
MPYDHRDLIARSLHQTIVGWRLSRILGQGASGVVFKGEPTAGQAPVAIKLYAQSIVEGSDALNIPDRIRRQKELCNHPCPYLVGVHDAGWAEIAGTRTPYVVMDYLSYPEYSHKRPIPKDRIAPLLAQVARAARYLDDRGYAHRDIKPGNVVLSQDNRSAVLVDLGVIKPHTGSMTYEETIQPRDMHLFLGTLRYGPPEFLNDQVQDDVTGWQAVTFYQLGALLFEMLSRREFFGDVTLTYPKLSDCIKQGLSFDDASLAGPESLKQLCRACLQVDPRKRHEAVRGLSSTKEIWDAFECVRLRRRPTVILLYAGGTIGSKDSDRQGSREVQRSCRNDQFLNGISNRLVLESGLFLPEGGAESFELKWEVIQPDHQQFSENFTPAYWNLLATTIRDVFFKYVHLPALLDGPHPGEPDDQALKSILETIGNPLRDGQFDSPDEVAAIIASSDRRRQLIEALFDEAKERYIAGVIVLHGTDTLAYSASALAFSLRYFPCPVLLTGSNQPPRENDFDQDPTGKTSDAWRNLMSCLHFLRSFGHRYAETFICFGDTIQHAINLRKISVRNLPLSASVDLDSLKEPFVFRNEALPQQYMFKCIEGLYCNNFYTDYYGVGRSVFGGRRSEGYHHLRPSPFGAIKPTDIKEMHECVGVATLFPSSFSGFVNHAEVAFDPKLRAVLIVGYDSGTIATEETHSFMRVLRKLEVRNIPIVLVSRYGIVPSQRPYKTLALVPVLRLIGVIPETALALLTVVASDIQDDVWDKATTAEARMALLEEGIFKYQSTRPSILTVLLGNVLDERQQWERISKYVADDNREYTGRLKAAKERARHLLDDARQSRASNPATSLSSDQSPRVFPPYVAFARGEFLLRELEHIRPYECAGSAPDGLAIVAGLGFKLGVSIGKTADALPFGPSGPQQIHAERGIHDFFSDLCHNLAEKGVVDIRLVGSGLSQDEGEGSWRLHASFRARRHGTIYRGDELLSAYGLDESERILLTKLRTGVPLEATEKEHIREVDDLLRRLHSKMWHPKISIVDWYLFGLVKGATCGLLARAQADSWIMQCGDKTEVLSRSVDLRIKEADDEEIEFTCSYTSRSYG